MEEKIHQWSSSFIKRKSTIVNIILILRIQNLWTALMAHLYRTRIEKMNLNIMTVQST